MSFIMPYAAVFGVLAVWVIGFITIFRKRLTCMVGMMAAMGLGMTVGLGIGTVIAFWIPGQMFHATMTSMLIGGLVGAATGLPISLMAVLDGLLSGIMSGMMGAMLAGMIPAVSAMDTIRIITVLCLGIIFVLFLMLQGELKPEHLTDMPFFLSKPASMFVFILVSFFILNQTTDLSASNSSHHRHEQQSTTQHVASKELRIKASEFSFTPGTLEIKRGEAITITLENDGNVEHDFEVIGTDIHVHALPGKSSSVTANFSTAGTYRALCTLPGHKEAGMISIIKVTN